jgi:hypothetical protein
MPYNNLISRSEVDAFIPEEVAAEVIQAVTAESAALTLCRTIPMGSNTGSSRSYRASPSPTSSTAIQVFHRTCKKMKLEWTGAKLRTHAHS